MLGVNGPFRIIERCIQEELKRVILSIVRLVAKKLIPESQGKPIIS